jgi:NAD(P)-dependent dehydrogenase (short-subunit alcohol dehydrogenase family)
VKKGDRVEVRGRVAIVTGASRGVGAAVAKALAAEGCLVACAARSTSNSPQRTPGTIDQTVREIVEAGGKAIAVPTNLAVEDEVVAMVERTVDHFGGVDILVNNAAVQFIGDLDIPKHRHEIVMNINSRAPMVAIREVAASMKQRDGGAIVNVSSAAALYPYPDMMSYGMSKAALERITIDAARQLHESGIAVNCFRIDIPVASEGFVANTVDADHSTWEPCEVAAEGILWMIRQPLRYSGNREGMYALRLREGIMKPQTTRDYDGPIPLNEMLNGLAPNTPSHYKEPYDPD